MPHCNCTPANKVSDDIGMKDHYFSAVLLLTGWGPVKVLPERCLNPDTVTKKLLKGKKMRE